MDDERRVKTSKLLSYYLRHHPDELGLTLAPGGWVDVEALLRELGARHGALALTRAQLDEVVARDDKGRFAIVDEGAGARIRANQGHSTAVDLALVPREPPALLYHGTAPRFAADIAATGLRRMARHHVHLSVDVETALRVGARRGRPVLFAVDAAAMARDGHLFYCSDNGVWLVDEVPPQYLQRQEDG